MKIKRLLEFASASVLSLSTLMTLGMPLAHALSYTCTWTGAGTDSKFSTAGNWSGCNATAPLATDTNALVFPVSVTNKSAVNDLIGATFTSITFNGSGGQSYSDFIVSGTPFTLTGGITDAISSTNPAEIDNIVTLSGNQTITDSATSPVVLGSAVNGGVSNVTLHSDSSISLKGIVSGSGAISKTGSGALFLEGINTFTGALNSIGGSIVVSNSSALGTSAGATSIGDTSDLQIGSCSSAFDVSENLTLTGASSRPSGSFVSPKLSITGVCAGGRGADQSYGAQVTTDQTYKLTGNVTLGSDITFGSLAKTVTLSGALAGNFNFKLLPEYSGSLILTGNTNATAMPNNTYNAAPVVQTLSDDGAAYSVEILKNAVITIDGKRGDTVVQNGGTLKGTGTVGFLNIAKGAVVAPGHSPGCLTSGNLILAGTYQAEIGGTDPCTGYDQLKVTGTVDLTGSTLDATLYGGFVPKVGQSYTIIDNDAADAVTGTFTGIANGGTYSNQGVTYTVNYDGGDGNDVVLTVKAVDAAAVPAKPDTGFALVSAHPLLALATSTLAAAAILVVARKLRPSTK